MVYNPKEHHRRTIRIQGFDYSSGYAYYITLCTQDKACILGRVDQGTICLSECGKIVDNIIADLPQRYPGTNIETYVIMPNHIHLIIQLNGDVNDLQVESIKDRRKMTLPKIIGYLKMNAGKRINIMNGTEGRSVWQKNYFEHVIRNEKAYIDIFEYIYNNPFEWNEDEYYPNPTEDNS